MPEYLIRNATGVTLYEKARAYPIYDYHCHLSPREIYLDEPLSDVAELWLACDHYKWRLMRAVGTPERLVTGDADYGEKFLAYAKAVEYAAGSPLYHWTKMELKQFFGIDLPLNPKNAAIIREKANAVIREKQLSPRKLILQSGVRMIGTTDDIADSLEYHEKLAADTEFAKKVKVLPSFRCDKLLLCRAPDYAAYIARLSEVVGFPISSLDSLKAAIVKRLDAFVRVGCAFTDLGIPDFPTRIADEAEAAETFSAALKAGEISDTAYSGFLGHLIVYLGQCYRERNLVMQLHLAVRRNANSSLFALAGPDSGGDCIGDPIPAADLIRVLDRIHSTSGLPETVLYTLNPAMNALLAAVAGSFPRVRCGAAWWFCDHKRGIREMVENIAEVGNLSVFLGMLTDSRSFLSYARHDYFRRILCDLVGEWVESGEFDPDAAEALVQKLCYQNVADLICQTEKE